MQAYEDGRATFHWEEWRDETLSFESSFRFTPLQAADMVSYEVRKSIVNRDIRPTRLLFQLLADQTEEGGHIGVVHYRERQYAKIAHTYARVFGLRNRIPPWVRWRLRLFSWLRT